MGDKTIQQLRDELETCKAHNDELFERIKEELEHIPFATIHDTHIIVSPPPNSNLGEIYIKRNGVRFADGEPTCPSYFVSILKDWVDYESQISQDLQEILNYAIDF